MSKSSSSSSLSPQDWKNVFDDFCKSTFIDESQLYGETVCKEIGERVMYVLKGKPSPAMDKDPFYIWVKTKGFALTSYPLLGLKEVLCVPSPNAETKASGSVSWRRVAYVEDFQNVIAKFHVKTGEHLTSEKTHTEVCKHYSGIPKLAVDKYLELCPVCSKKQTCSDREATLTVKKNNFMKKGQVEVIDITDKPLGPFPHICLYIDMYSNYHIIFPLSSHNADDIAINLRKYVFPYFGMPKRLCSSMGSSFIDSLLEATSVHWPDAVAIRNGSKKPHDTDHLVHKKAQKSKSLISDLFESCRSELEGVQWTLSACSDLLLSLQYQLNTSTSKKNTRKSPYELIFGIPPYFGPHSDQNSLNISSSDDDEPQSNRNITDYQLTNNNRDVQSSSDDMNRLIHKSSGAQQPSQQLQQMLSRTSSIQAQEQQVTSLRELLRQEESRLELLKKMRQPATNSTTTTGGSGPLKETQRIGGGGVIRSGDTNTIGHHLNNGSQSNISVRLQQLVDSVAVDQMSTKYGITNHNTSLVKSDHTKSVSPEVITISDSPSPASPPALISSVPSVIHGAPGQKIDESFVMKTIENSRKYRDFVVRQNNVKRNFQKQMDKKISSFSYPKTFRQVWPIIPVQDPSFVKNLGLETVTQFFEQNPNSKTSNASKVKPICNQCGCDFASAWQIRKNNSKQVLLCEACDFTNLKLLQRTKLATQLKEVVESVKKEEDKFNGETEEARKQLIAVERVAVISQKSNTNTQQGATNVRTISDRVVDSVLPSYISSKTTTNTSTINDKASAFSSTDRKRRLEQPTAPPITSKAPKTHLDQTLNRITQQLLLKQVDEKVHQKRHRDTPSPVPAARNVVTKKTPPPLVEDKDVIVVNHSSQLVRKTPPPLTSATPTSTDSRRNRRKGQPRQNVVMLNDV